MELHRTDRIFNENALLLLNHRLETADSAEDFFAEVDSIANDAQHTLILPSPIEFENPLSGEDSNDAEAAIAVLEAVGFIDRTNASDPRLWNYLGLVTLRDYMSKRWPLGDLDEFRVVIKRRWLLSSSPNARLLTRHGIARLWWVAFLSHDPHFLHALSREKDDEFAYTRWIFEKQDRFGTIFERELGWNASFIWATIDGAETYKKDGMPDRATVRKSAIELTLRSGYQQLEILSLEEIMAN